MGKIKMDFELENNDAYPDQRGQIVIIGERPTHRPYLSVAFYKEGNQISHSWLPDKDLERFAVNILKALKSKKLKH